MQLWDEILYPSFRATIRGEYYGFVSEDFIDEECFHLAERAVSTFKFPRISTEYNVLYYKRVEGVLTPTTADDPDGIPHGQFVNDLTIAEIDVLVGWMKFYWAENQVSNANNFDEIYTDANIKTYSRANAVDKNMQLMREYRTYAQELETRYSRVNGERKSSIGDINSDE